MSWHINWVSTKENYPDTKDYEDYKTLDEIKKQLKNQIKKVLKH